jgi:DNA-binding GntR family transcriptional regulator
VADPSEYFADCVVIFSAIHDRDADRARDAVLAHLHRMRQDVLAALGTP